MACDLVLIGSLDERILRGRSPDTKHRLFQPKHNRHVDVNRASIARIENADCISTGLPHRDRQLGEQFAYLGAGRSRLDDVHRLQIRQHSGSDSHVLTHRRCGDWGSIAVSTLHHAPHGRGNLACRRLSPTRSRRQRQRPQERLARLLDGVLERIERAAHRPFASLDEVCRRPAPGRPKPRQAIGIGRLRRPGETEERIQHPPERRLDERALILADGLDAGLPQLTHKPCAVRRTARTNNRNALPDNPRTQGLRDATDDDFGLAALALNLGRGDTRQRGTLGASVRLCLTEPAFQRRKAWVAIKRARRQLDDAATTGQVGQPTDDRRQDRKGAPPSLVRQTHNGTSALSNQRQQRLLRQAEVVEALSKERLTCRPSSHVSSQCSDCLNPQTCAVNELLLIKRRPPECIALRQRGIACGTHIVRSEQSRTKPVEPRRERRRSVWQGAPQHDLPRRTVQHRSSITGGACNALKQRVERDDVRTHHARGARQKFSLRHRLGCLIGHDQRSRAPSSKFGKVALVERRNLAGVGRTDDQFKGHGDSSRPKGKPLRGLLGRRRLDALSHQRVDALHAIRVGVVDLDEGLPLDRDRVLRKDRLDRALWLAGTAVNALLRIDHQHAIRFVDAIDRTDVHTGPVFRVNTWLGDDVRHKFLRVDLRAGSIPEGLPARLRRTRRPRR